MNYWDVVDATKNVLLQSKASGECFEGAAALVQKAAMDWLSTVFKGKTMDEVRRLLLDRTDSLYDNWVEHAEKIHGIYSIAAQQTGWEMIMHGGLLDLPGRDRYY